MHVLFLILQEDVNRCFHTTTSGLLLDDSSRNVYSLIKGNSVLKKLKSEHKCGSLFFVCLSAKD